MLFVLQRYLETGSKYGIQRGTLAGEVWWFALVISYEWAARARG